ncbi:hypothetical protein [Borreliella garinii]|uniref:hypothetical protein n=1 Tax=Borreliella garinii TaxID=29519 RepID=UPI001AEE1891|nr:hypothetical protein [Borreliella garinii]
MIKIYSNSSTLGKFSLFKHLITSSPANNFLLNTGNFIKSLPLSGVLKTAINLLYFYRLTILL